MHHFLVSLPLVTDSVLNACVRYAMLSMDFEQAFSNYKQGTDIWYGVAKNDIETYAGIYYKNVADSTRLYVLTTFSLERKSKVNMSELICFRIGKILAQYLESKTRQGAH